VARADLLALTPQSLAALANVGLVKWAQRELAAGKAPRLEEGADGTVTGWFPDGAVTRLPPGKPLKQTPCSCGALNDCRHRVALVLAYQAAQQEQAQHDDAAGSTATPGQNHATDGPGEENAADATPAWSPADIDDDALLQHVGKRLLERARGLLASRPVVTVERRGEVPTVRFPTCTVRFLVPRDLTYAQCDCKARQGCEHIAAAVWACRQAGTAPHRTFEVQPLAGQAAHVAEVADDHGGLDDVAALLAELLRHGVVNMPTGLAAQFATTRRAVERRQYCWLMHLLDDVEQLLEAYRARSARYEAGAMADLLIEMGARVRAAQTASSPLPARYVLGAEVAPETRLDSVSLVSLGARISGDERQRVADIYLADPESGDILVLQKVWSFSADQHALDGPQLAARSVAANVTLGALAHGHLLSHAARRAANRRLTLGRTRTTVLPHATGWDKLPPELLLRDLAGWQGGLELHPPALLEPRLLGSRLKVVAIGEVLDTAWSAAQQEMTVTVTDTSGTALRLVRRHRSMAPGACGALTQQGLRYVSGDLRRTATGFVMDPVALLTDRILVLDLMPASDIGAARPIASGPKAAHPLEQATGCLAAAAHYGLGASLWWREATDVVKYLDAAGYMQTAKTFRSLLDRVGHSGEASHFAVEAWLNAGICLTMLQENA
jgi:hypothetical protein